MVYRPGIVTYWSGKSHRCSAVVGGGIGVGGGGGGGVGVVVVVSG